MIRSLPLLALLVFAAPAAAANLKVKVEDTPLPKELADPVKSLLDSKAMVVTDASSKPLATVWPRKSLDSKATAEQAEKGLRYNHIAESTVLGAVQFHQEWSDYRKQKIKPGVYTLRMGIQPMDGDHMGTAPYSEFALLAPVAMDTKPDLLDTDSLHELSSNSTTRKHPGLVMLMPNRKPADAPAIEDKPMQHEVLSFSIPVNAGGKKAPLGFSAVFVGHTTAE
jgi:hypothetical protein